LAGRALLYSMPDFFTTAFGGGQYTTPWLVLARLLAALLFGGVVAWIYVRTTSNGESGTSFPTTLALLAVLIAMVTQVIGDNVARAFSLVGALSIVRFRTVVRDTKDTAFVIFAVVVGMAVCAHNPWVAVIGTVVIGATALLSAARNKTTVPAVCPMLLTLRMGLGHDLEKIAGSTLDAHLASRHLLSAATARQGAAFEMIFETHLRPDVSAEQFVKALNRLDGVQEVRLHRRGFEQD